MGVGAGFEGLLVSKGNVAEALFSCFCLFLALFKVCFEGHFFAIFLFLVVASTLRNADFLDFGYRSTRATQNKLSFRLRLNFHIETYRFLLANMTD